MAKLTPKENFTKMINGEIPESVPLYTMGMFIPGAIRPPTHTIGPFIGVMSELMERIVKGEEMRPQDPKTRRMYEWGSDTSEEQGGQIPGPGNFMLKDIRDWKKLIKKPAPLESAGSFWREKAEKDERLSGIDRTQSLAAVSAIYAPFASLITLMGFTEGLYAMFEEPEEVKEFLNWQCDYYMPAVEQMARHYRADLLSMSDDTAARHTPFFPVEIYEDIFKPIYRRLSEPFTRRGLWVEFHNCGRCEDFLPGMCDFGVKGWDPAQTTNDLIKAKRENDISILGGYDFAPPPGGAITEEIVRQSVRDTFAKYAPGGRYAFLGRIMTNPGDPNGVTWNRWLMDEARKLAGCYYEKH